MTVISQVKAEHDPMDSKCEQKWWKYLENCNCQMLHFLYSVVPIRLASPPEQRRI